jgi:putative transcription factor
MLFSYFVFHQARRIGAVVGTDRKTTGGTNKAHQGTFEPYTSSRRLTLVYHFIGTDHQKIAKIDRENEVAPPPKISLTVGKVRALRGRSRSTF